MVHMYVYIDIYVIQMISHDHRISKFEFLPLNHPSVFGLSASDRCFLPNAASMTLSAGQEGTVWRRWNPRPKGTEGAAYLCSVA